MSEKQPIMDRKRYILRTLTHVHIGNGATLSKQIDIKEEQHNRRVLVLDLEKALQKINPKDAGMITNRDSLLHALQRNRVPLEQVCLHILNNRSQFPANDLRLAIRDGAGRPIIPGSSIKGSMRTMLFANSFASKKAPMINLSNLRNQPKPPKFACQDLESKVFRSQEGARNKSGPRSDVLRSLLLTDAVFDPGNVGVVFAKVNSPGRGGENKRMKGFAISVEAICPGSEGEVEIGLDRFLQGDEGKKIGFDKMPLTLDRFATWSREHYLRHIESEKKWFNNLGWEKVAEELSEIKHQLEDVPPDNIVLRLGWGIGWLGMTGGVLSPEQRLELASIFGNKITRLPPHAYPPSKPFPKSRKIANAQPEHGAGQTFGWVVLAPAGQRRVSISFPATQKTNTSSQQTSPQQKQQEETEPAVFQIFRALKHHQYAGQMANLVSRAESLPDEKKRLFSEMVIQTIKQKNLTKSLKKKPWFGKLKSWNDQQG